MAYDTLILPTPLSKSLLHAAKATAKVNGAGAYFRGGDTPIAPHPRP